MNGLPPSNRARKRMVQEGVRRLRGLPGWDPTRRVPDEDPLAGPRGALEAEQWSLVEDESRDCPDCQARRQQAGDPSALCDRHLARALGLDGHRG